MEIQMGDRLTPSKCYVGQRVYWVMWFKEEEDRKAWVVYRPGLTPEIWTAIVEKLVRNSIMLESFGRAHDVFSCELDAIRWAYKDFVSNNLRSRTNSGPCELGEASRVLRALAELEYGLHSPAGSSAEL
jgi:hypothetical protein